MAKVYFDKAILEINPNAEFVLIGDNLDDIQWLSGTTPISKTDIETKSNEIATRDAHIEPRQNAYPSIQEQLDMQYKDAVNGTTTWKDAIQAVKDEYPKA